MRLSWEEVKYLIGCTGMQDHPHQLRYLATRDALHSQGAIADTETLELQFCGETGHASDTIGLLLHEKRMNDRKVSIMKITITKENRVVKEESFVYCCGDMQGAIDNEQLRKPITSAQTPAILLGTRIVNFCPFCGAKVEVVVR